MSDESRHRENLRAAIANRAMIYYRVWQVIRARHGEAEASAIMREAIYAQGCAVGEAFKHIAPNDMAGIRDAFLAFLPDHELLQPDVQADENGVDIKFGRCPLKEAWQAAGLADDEVAKLCAIAGVVDNGTFESAGFTFSAETWQPGETGCCHLHIRPGLAGD